MTYDQITAIAIIVLSVSNIIMLIICLYLQGKARHHTKLVNGIKQADASMLSKETQAKLQTAVQTNFQLLVEQASHNFAGELEDTSKKLNEEISRLTAGVISNELEQYRTALAGVRQQATHTLQEIQTTVDASRQQANRELAQEQVQAKQRLEAEVASERERLLHELDSRMGDIVASYLIECLGQGVDLGAQNAYLLRMLEEHKQELKKDLGSGV